MSRVAGVEYVSFEPEKIKVALKSCGVQITKVSALVLGKSPEYISKALSTGRMDTEALKKFCEFLSVKYDDIILTEPKAPKAKPAQVDDNLKTTLDLLLVAMTDVSEQLKKQNELMEEIVTQVKASSVKANRFENAVGQTLSNTIAIKDTLTDIVKQGNERNSALNMVTGRLKDIYENTKPKKTFDNRGKVV